MQGLMTLGPCRPDELIGGCKSPLTVRDLEGAIDKIAMASRGMELTIAVGDLHYQLAGLSLVGQSDDPSRAETLKRGLSAMTSYLSGPEGNHIGMLHWRDYAVLFMKHGVIMDVIRRGYFSRGQDYAALVRAINKTGLSVVDANVS